MNIKDTYLPNGKWEFNKEVTEVFPDMISRSIPGYGLMRDSVVRMAQPILGNSQHNLFLLDIGCSCGDTIYDILDSLETPERVDCVGIDSSQDMINSAQNLFEGWSNVRFISGDIVDTYITPGKFNVITSVLTAQFVPIDTRQELFKTIYTGLSVDGVFIIVEKILGETPDSQSILVDAYHKFKKDKGYTDEQIDTKRKSLQGVLVPMRGSENEAMLRDVGFKTVQRFWQCLNFAGWIALK